MTIAVYARNTKDNHAEYLEQLVLLSAPENFKIVIITDYSSVRSIILVENN